MDVDKLESGAGTASETSEKRSWISACRVPNFDGHFGLVGGISNFKSPEYANTPVFTRLEIGNWEPVSIGLSAKSTKSGRKTAK